MTTSGDELILPIDRLDRSDVAWAGGKGANLGELASADFPVPSGFVVGAPAYRLFRDEMKISALLSQVLVDLDPEDTGALSRAADECQQLIHSTPIPEALAEQVTATYLELVGCDQAVAVRSSATAEDTEEASFAGMNESFLNVVGESALLEAVRSCWASMFGARSIYYRLEKGMSASEMDIAVVVQEQIFSEKSGVMFTIDPASGLQDRLVIESSFGLGESVVSGSVSPDHYVISKDSLEVISSDIASKEVAVEAAFMGGSRERQLEAQEAEKSSLSRLEVREIAMLGLRIEDHFKRPQDTEWAIDSDGETWITQTRPITAVGDGQITSARTDEILSGLGSAPGVGSGQVRIVSDLAHGDELQEGEVLVAHMTAPDWVPLMRKAAGVITDSGGMTCHAAIVSRELGIPCVVGTGEATSLLRDGQEVTIDAGSGRVFEGLDAVEPESAVQEPEAETPTTRTLVQLNLSETSQVEKASRLPADGVGLLRAELMITEALDGRHPRLLIEQGKQDELTGKLASALEVFAVGFEGRPITYRSIDFRSNEFRGLEGGDRFEPVEANPMIGYRGALRYTREPDLFALELAAIKQVWEKGHRNLHLMLPFVRRPGELSECREQISASGLLEEDDFELWIMAEVPSVLFHLGRYAEIGITGISIGSNDLTQLVLGADRDSELLSETFDERDEAVVEYIEALIERALELDLRTSICGQAPSVYPEYTAMLVAAGIESISVSTDALVRTRSLVAEAEQADG